MIAAQERFPRIDAMRAVAALSIVLYHLNGYTAFPSTGLQGPAFRADIGVSIFFLISSFVLYRPFVAAHVRGQATPALLPYTVRRVARIVPAFWIATTIVGVLQGQQYLWTLRGFVHIYGFLQVYTPDLALAGIGVSWSLCVEVVLYAVLPLLAAAALGLARRARVTPLRAHGGMVVGLFVLGLAYQVVAVQLSDPNLPTSGPVYLTFPAYLDQCALGMGLAVWSVAASAGRPWAVRPYARLLAHPSLPALVAVAVFIGAGLMLGRAGLPGELTNAEWILRHVSYGLLALLLLLPAVLQGPAHGLVQRVLESRVLRGVGVISYGVYLFHMVVLHELGLAVSKLGLSWLEHPDNAASKLVFATLLMAGVVLAGTLSWVLVERPAQRLARRVGRRPSTPGPPTAPAVAATGG